MGVRWKCVESGSLIKNCRVFVLLLLVSAARSHPSRTVTTRYGKVQGVLLKHPKSMEIFLGVPYASPPTGANRFSPTRAPVPWDGVRLFNSVGPVCPQWLPDVANETAALERMPRGRLEHLKRLLPFLKNQSEDCLYLNIFAPAQGKEVPEAIYPVVVYIHGESYNWNSGNPYDGRVLANYADVIVITLNYRLGVLGFLNTNTEPYQKARVANYGLMDQIAALHWIQQNIMYFGGDTQNITMMGHGTGAACINFLMISPAVMPGLFHRAILLSGSAFSNWALVDEPIVYSMEIARQLNCTTMDVLNHEHIIDCLREVPIGEIMKTRLTSPTFTNSFGPSVDGVVIKANFREEFLANAIPEMQSYAKGIAADPKSKDTKSIISSNRYDVLFGCVTSESLSRFSNNDILSGFEGDRRDRIIRTYVRNTYSYHLTEIFFTIVNEYTDWERTVLHPINTRDATIAALSDAQFVSPLILTGDLFSRPQSKGNIHPINARKTTSYFYVFDYQTKDGDYPQRMGTVHGEELPYVFGAPLTESSNHFARNYTKSEVALSEAFMIYIGNFARTGNPNEYQKHDAALTSSKERNRFRGVVWEEYDATHQKYLEIGAKTKIKNHFRAHQLSVWLRLIPELHRTGMEDVTVRHAMFDERNVQLYEGIVKGEHRRNYNGSVSEVVQITTGDPPTVCVTLPSSIADANSSEPNEPRGLAAFSTSLGFTITIGCTLLILNLIVFAAVYYQRDKARLALKNLKEQLQQHSNCSSPYGSKTIPRYQPGSIMLEMDTADVMIHGTLPRTVHKCPSRHFKSHIINSTPDIDIGLNKMHTFSNEPKTPNGSLIPLSALPKPPPPPKSSPPAKSQPLLTSQPHLGPSPKNTLKMPTAAISEMRV